MIVQLKWTDWYKIRKIDPSITFLLRFNCKLLPFLEKEWSHGPRIMFDTEEDYMMFKLKFGV